MNTIETDTRNAIVDAIGGKLDIGTGEPTAIAETSSGAPLMTVGLNATRAIAAAVDGVGVFNNPTTGGSWSNFSQLPIAVGTIARMSIKDGNGLERFRMSVGVVGSGAEWIFTTLLTDVLVAITMNLAPTIIMPSN
jgi:hypothetical protein